MTADDTETPLLLDANVLIDYCQSDVSILALASRQRLVYIASPILHQEVEQLDDASCEEQGLRILDPAAE